MSYGSGVYTPASRDSVGLHATVAIGFGSGYILSVNSWGTGWGADGLFKINDEAITGLVAPGSITGHGIGYPLPIPGGGLPSLDLWGTWRLVSGPCSVSSRG